MNLSDELLCRLYDIEHMVKQYLVNDKENFVEHKDKIIAAWEALATIENL